MNYQEKVEFGIGGRASGTGFLLARLKDISFEQGFMNGTSFGFGYAYDYYFGDLRGIGGSHEIFLSMKFSKSLNIHPLHRKGHKHDQGHHRKDHGEPGS